MKFLSLVFVILFAILAPLSFAENAGPIEVQITVMFEDGAPVPNFGVMVESGAARAEGTIDDSGRVTIKAELPDEAESFHININARGSRGTSRPVSFRELADLLRRYVVDTPGEIKIEPGRGRYECEIVFRPAAQVILRTVDEAGQPVDTLGILRVRDGVLGRPGRSDSEGVLVVGGIAPGRDAELMIHASGGRVFSVSVAALGGPGTVDLGVLTLPPPEPGCPFVFEIGNSEILIRTADHEGTGLTLLERVGNHLFSFMAKPDGYSVFARESGEFPKIGPGEYYVLPGTVIRGSGRNMWAVDQLRAGRDLSDSGIPILTVTGEEDEVHFEFDALAADNAIRKLMAEDEEARKQAAEEAKEEHPPEEQKEDDR